MTETTQQMPAPRANVIRRNGNLVKETFYGVMIMAAGAGTSCAIFPLLLKHALLP